VSKPVLTIALALVVLTVVLFAVGASGARYYRPSPREVITTALKSPRLQGAAVYFRGTPGQQRCRLHGGGPPPGSVAIGTCWTDVWFHSDGSATVRLMISPPYTRIDDGETWVFHVSRSLRVKLVKQPANFGIGAEA